MRLEPYRCEKCVGIALVDADKYMPNTELPCPYCHSRAVPSVSIMLPFPRTLTFPDDFLNVQIRFAPKAEK